MKLNELWATFFLATLSQGVSAVTQGEILKAVTSEKFVQHAIVDQILNIYAPVSNSFDNDLCRSHGKRYKDGVKKGELWAMKMFDSSSKVPDGVLMMNWAQLGNFDECVQIEDVPSESGAFSGQHCMVTMLPSFANVEQQSALGRINEIRMAFGNPVTRDALYFTNEDTVAFRWSICVPSSCRAKDVQQHLQTALPGNLTIFVKDSSCYSKATEPPFSATDWFAVGLLVFFALLVVLSTSYDLTRLHSGADAGTGQPVLTAFSLYSNGVKLLGAPCPRSSDNLACLHGIRVISIAWVMLFHRYSFAQITPSINKVVLLDHVRDWSHLISTTNATVSVDSFLLLSGVLVCYTFMKEREKGAAFNIFLYYFHRYVRLTPAYAVVILFTATLSKVIGDGPLWRDISEPQSFTCQHNWWINLLYLNNYVRASEECVAPSWYLAVDMQLFWLSPLLLLPLWKWPKFGKALIGFLIGVGLLIAFLIPYITEVRATTVSGWDGDSVYLPTHTRFTPWLIGIGLGYILHKTKRTTIRLATPLVSLGWFLSFGLMLTSWLLMHRFFQIENQYERAFESLYACLMRPAWALGLAWLVFACVKGYGGFIDTFLSWSFFQVLSRLTYSVYLIHNTLQIWDAGSTKAPIYLSDRTIVLKYFGDLMMAFPAAFLLSAVFEAPALIIERHFLGGRGKKATPAKKKDATKSHQDPEGADKEAGIESEEFNTNNNTHPD